MLKLLGGAKLWESFTATGDPVAAGYLIGRFIGQRAAKVALIAGSRSYLAHEEREAGFLHVLAELFEPLEVVGLREGHDDSEQNFAQTASLLE